MRIRNQIIANLAKIREEEETRERAIVVNIESVEKEVEKYLESFKETRLPMSYEMVESLYKKMKGGETNAMLRP